MVEQCRADIHITKIGEMYVQNRRAIEGIRIIEHTVIRGECFSATVVANAGPQRVDWQIFVDPICIAPTDMLLF